MNKQRFVEGFWMQLRIINALLRRDLISLTGKRGASLLMLIFEPILFVVVISLFVYMKGGIFKNIPVAAFVMSGYTIMWCVRFQLMKIVPAIATSRPLLYHRFVKISDVLFSRVVTQFATTSLTLFLFVPLVCFKVIDYPQEIPLMVGSWLLVSWYAIAIAFISAAISSLYKIGPKVSMLIAILHIWITGAFFMVEWLPGKYRSLMLFFPMVNATEMMRDGLFGNIVTTHYSILYIMMCNIVLTYIGLAMIRKLSLRGAVDDSD